MKAKKGRTTRKTTGSKAKGPQDVDKVRKEVVNVIVGESVKMAVRSVQSVQEGGNVTALKYLWEVAGLFPGAAATPEGESQPSMAEVLMERLGLSGEMPADEDTNSPGDVESEEMQS